VEPLTRGCKLGFAAACQNLRMLTRGGTFSSPPPTIQDFPIILRGSKGDIGERSQPALYALACAEGWLNTCGRGGK
jgi:hypothetical protein